MLLEKLPRSAAFGALVVSVGFAGLGTAVAAPRNAAAPAAPVGQAAQSKALRMAVSAVGGSAALRGLDSFRFSARGRTWIHDEGVRPGMNVRPDLADTFTSRVRLVRNQGLRVDSVRTSNGAARRVHEVLNGRRGFIRGVDNNGSTATTTAMTSDRWAAIRREQMLLSPQLLLRQAMLHPRTTRDAGRQRLDGKSYRVLVIKNSVAPIRLFIDRRTGRLARLRTLDFDFMRRNVVLDVRFQRWVRAGSGLLFPRRVTLRSDGDVLHREVRRGLDANPTISPRAFRFPANLGPAPFSKRLARIGSRTTEWLMSFAHLGFIKDGGQTAINPTQVAPGVIFLGGVADNSMVVRTGPNTAVVVEGALHNFRAEAVMRFVQRRFNGVRITHVLTTHFHADHASGMRPYVARGAQVVIGQPSAAFFRQVFAQRNPKSLLPDRLDRRPNVQARVTGVGAQPFRLQTPRFTVEMHRFATNPVHSTDMSIVYVEQRGGATGGNELFVSDVYTPGAPPGANGQALNNLIVNQGLDVDTIVGGHGATIAYADFVAQLG